VTSLLHLRQNLLYLYSFLYIRPNGALVEVETCRNYIVNDNFLFIINGAICWIKCKTYIDVRDLVSELKICFLSFLVWHLLPTHVRCRGLLYLVTLRHTTLGRPFGRVIGPLQRSLLDSPQHSLVTNIHAPGGIRTRYPSKRAVADPRLRHRGHRGSSKKCFWTRNRAINLLFSWSTYSPACMKQ